MLPWDGLSQRVDLQQWSEMPRHQAHWFLSVVAQADPAVRLSGVMGWPVFRLQWDMGPVTARGSWLWLPVTCKTASFILASSVATL